MQAKKNNINELKVIAKFLREQIVNISYKTKAHHIGSEFACIDILVALYFNVMEINSFEPKDINRDWFLLSKGHAALAQYTILAKKGFFKDSIISKEFLQNGGRLGGHPDYGSVPGIEASSGSLGHGLSIGAGVALARKKDRTKGNVYILLGDGECNEGMIWEAVMFASHHNLNNLIAIIDYNKLQGLGRNNDIIKLDSLKKKFESFGWKAKEIDGHDFHQLIESLSISKNEIIQPSVVIAHTIKGKGVKSMENKLSSHYEVISNIKRRDEIIKELNE